MTPADGRVVGTIQIVDHGPAAERFNIAIMGDGYQDAQLAQFAHDAQSVVDALFAERPFSALKPAINVFRIDVSSTDSGAADPVQCGGSGVDPRTYFDATFCNGGIRRALTVNTQTALDVARTQVPQFHQAMVIVNSPLYGGTGGSVAVQSIAPGATEIALHELGHSAFDLADEYEYYAGCGAGGDAPGTHDRYPGGEPAEPNVTADSNRATNKWRDLVAATTAMPTTRNADCTRCDPQDSPVPAGTVGTFEGARYYHCGAYRPEYACKMRALNNPYCAVCRRVISRTLAPFLPQQAYVAFQANDGDHELFVSASEDGLDFPAATCSPDVRIGSAPALAVFNNRLYVAFQANDGDHELFVSASEDGLDFPAATCSPDVRIGSSPALAVFNNRLYVAFQANDDSHRLFVSASEDGLNFPAATRSPDVRIGSSPAIIIS